MGDLNLTFLHSQNFTEYLSHWRLTFLVFTTFILPKQHIVPCLTNKGEFFQKKNQRQHCISGITQGSFRNWRGFKGNLGNFLLSHLLRDLWEHLSLPKQPHKTARIIHLLYMSYGCYLSSNGAITVPLVPLGNKFLLSVQSSDKGNSWQSSFF